MNKFRLLAAGGAAVLVTASLWSPANADTSGVGTAEAAATLLDVDLFGSIAQVEAVRDSSLATTDPARSKASAAASVVPLKVGSDTNDALDFTAPEVAVSSTSGQDSRSETPAALPSELAAVASGSFNPVDLLARVDSAGAKATVDSSLASLLVGGGIVSADSLVNELSSHAAGTVSSASREVSAETVAVLDLGALLEGLGIDLEALPTADLLAALDAAGLSVPDVGDAGDVQALLDSANAAIDELQDVLDSVLPDVSTEVSDALADLLGDGTTNPVDTGDPAAVNAAIDDLQELIAGSLSSVLATLDGAPVFQLNDVSAGVGTSADDAVSSSTAVVSASIGSITVGGVTIAGVDLLDAKSEIDAAVASAVGRLNGILAAIDPALGGSLNGLTDIVSLSLLDSGTSVEKVGAYVESLASLTLASVTITPPTDLSGILGAIDAATGIGAQISAAGGTVPEVGAAMTDVEAATGSDNPLAQGASVRVFSLSASSNFTPTGAPVSPQPSLAATGGETDLLMVGAAALVFLAVAARRRSLAVVEQD